MNATKQVQNQVQTTVLLLWCEGLFLSFSYCFCGSAQFLLEVQAQDKHSFKGTGSQKVINRTVSCFRTNLKSSLNAFTQNFKKNKSLPLFYTLSENRQTHIDDTAGIGTQGYGEVGNLVLPVSPHPSPRLPYLQNPCC